MIDGTGRVGGDRGGGKTKMEFLMDYVSKSCEFAKMIFGRVMQEVM